MVSSFDVKDSGKRKVFDSGMVRDTSEGKTDYTNVLHGPMFKRWAEHLTKAKSKYEDVAPGVPNWTLGDGPEEMERFRVSAFRHFVQWLNGDRDEDHAAAVFFNINGYERLRDMELSREKEISDRISELARMPVTFTREEDVWGYEVADAVTSDIEGVPI